MVSALDSGSVRVRALPEVSMVFVGRKLCFHSASLTRVYNGVPANPATNWYLIQAGKGRGTGGWGVEILLVVSCNRGRDKRRPAPDGSLVSYADFTFLP